MATFPGKRSKTGGQKALVIGVSDYPPPIPKLPAVAADVREMAKLLRSRDGAFPATGVTVLTDGQATRNAVLTSLKETFEQAAGDETTFVYLAGHGGVEDDGYYYISHDTDAGRMAATGVPLTEIKALFDDSPSSRAFLWLDFCHSGGILARGKPRADDQAMIRRTLEVVRGQGKIIVAACTSSQSAYEDSAVGHGLFTDALLRGLKGNAASGGEVTANSLYDFIDREVGSHRQRPMFFGHTTGRLVLMHYQDRSADAALANLKPGKAAAARADGTWIMLGRHYFIAQTVRSNKDGSITLVVSPADGEEEANLAGLRPGPYGGSSTLSFAWNNDAGSARIREVESELAGGHHTWTITLTPQDGGSGGVFNEMSINTGSKSYSAEDIARLRAGRILLNDPPEMDDRESRSFGSDGFLEGCIRGASSGCEVRTSPIRSVHAEHGRNPDWKHFARLQTVYSLKVSRTVDHILELSFGTVRSGGLPVRFRGRRDRLGSERSSVIEITGVCPLG